MDTRLELEEAQASFRGIPFFVISRGRGGGRRGPMHQMPMRDEPDGEDLGRRCRTFRVSALVIGQGTDDASRDADAEDRAQELIAALEDKSGPGVYRDPWHGSWSVICRVFDSKSDTHRSGIVAFEIAFEESGDTRYPQASTATSTVVGSGSDDLGDQLASLYDSRLQLSGQVEWVAGLAHGVMTSGAAAINAISLVQLDPLSALGIGDASAGYQSLISAIDALQAGSLIGEAFTNAVRAKSSSAYSTRGGAGDPQAARAGFASLYDWDPGSVAASSTPARAAAAANQAATVNLIRGLAVSEEARALAACSWESIDQAQAQRDDLLGRLQAVQRQAIDDGADSVAAAVGTLRAAVIADVAARAPALRRRTATMTAVLPARVVAYRLLGDATQADDLVARNGIAHPLFVPAAQPLEYLSNG